MSNFNKQLKILREERGLSQRELAEKIALSKSSINMYERGEREPGIETLKRIALFFNVDIDYLLGKSTIRRKSLKIGNIESRTIGKNIRSFREKMNMSQKELASLLGVKESFIINLEAGKCTLTKEQTFRICDIFHTTPDFINGTITELLEDGDLDAEYRLSNQTSPDQTILTEGEQKLLELFRLIPEENRAMVLEMIRAAVNTQL